MASFQGQHPRTRRIPPPKKKTLFASLPSFRIFFCLGNQRKKEVQDSLGERKVGKASVYSSSVLGKERALVIGRTLYERKRYPLSQDVGCLRCPQDECSFLFLCSICERYPKTAKNASDAFLRELLYRKCTSKLMGQVEKKEQPPGSR